MNDYMRALHQRFFQEPDFTELEEEIEQARQEVREGILPGFYHIL